MKITSLGHGKFMATNGEDTLTAVYERGKKCEDGQFHPHWNFELNGTLWTEPIGKGEAVELARKLLDEPMREPLTKTAALEMQHRDGSVHGVVSVTIHEVIDNDLDGFLDIINERLSTALLCDMRYRIVGCGEDGLSLHVRVSGYIDEDEESEE